MKWRLVGNSPPPGQLVGTVGSTTYDGGLAFLWLSSDNQWFNQWHRKVKPPTMWFEIPEDAHVAKALDELDRDIADRVRQRRSRQ
jgi:hypothetical protein